ncbi:MAG TPA: acetyl-CoA carboxylase biotin carboxylase subunit [Stellaceae bacterium]|jgi:3-methylcrotonyl-CoA carboxylase alpha subunit|nr:acetyl-CoA carboxylase biotin carboxylase subunit [Stellaceae bacterium]
MFSKILIANRGEIACRVIRTARRMGVATVAVYSEADAGALHVAMADEARLIGAAPARESYLKAEVIVAAARETGAEAVHPGYGFLSENAEFAEACAVAGLVFIGPPASAIRAMGSKSAAKAMMAAAGVPVVPGYHGDDQSPDRLLAEAGRIGFPVMIKASAGGGGRGMREVASAAEFPRALEAAKREAAGAFGDDRVLVERLLTAPRHIEVQVFADTHGNTVHLFERDCSIQRRHQKVVEEAPAPGLSPAQRAAMGEAAVAAAAAVGYVGAGTVEFIAEGGDFYFMEMNTRLQVEHPVTEAVTGLDLVEWQLRVAAGETLPRRQNQIALDGHAIEVRLYAENPARGFLPATGTLHGLRLPVPEAARVDTGVREGDAVTPFYDAMIAKIVAWGPDREAARRRLARALGDSAVYGPATNLAFLARIAGDAEFAAAKVDTGFIERRRDTLIPPPAPVPPVVLAAAVWHRFAGAPRSGDPWSRRDGWRLNTPPAPIDFRFRCGDEMLDASVTANGDGWLLSHGDMSVSFGVEVREAARMSVTLGDARAVVTVFANGDEIAVGSGGELWRLVTVDPLAPPEDAQLAAGRLSAPMPGRVIQLFVATGDAVRRGQPLLVIEAMKMEHTIAAPHDGTVASVPYAVGDLVEEGAELIQLTPAT